jgi:hypothetical protein
MRIESPRKEDGKPAMKQRRRRSAWPLAALIAMSAGACVPSFVKSVEDDHSRYYRLKVQLTYKGTPQDFDIVVGCNVREIFYKDNSTTYEAGLVPSVFGRRMSDGKALVVRPPNACDGKTTANGQVPPDLLPIVVVYDDADTLDFGVAYLSDDAYEGPLSVLKFGGATIEAATRAEFEAFRSAQPNLVTRESYFRALAADDVLQRMNLRRLAKPWAHICEGYKRFRIGDGARPLVRQDWPQNHPEYWVTDERRFDPPLFNALMPDRYGPLRTDRKDDIARPKAAYDYPDDYAADSGALRRGNALSDPDRRYAASYYPAASDYRIDRWPTDPKDWPSYAASRHELADVDIDFRGGSTRGFAYCYDGVESELDPESKNSIIGRRVTGHVDGQSIVSKRTPDGGPVLILERDEYFFIHFQFYLESTRGDV